MLNAQKLQQAIAVYKKHFNETSPNEQYKWEALAWFQQHLDSNTSDFGAMVIEGLGKTGNLLDVRMYYPLGVLQDAHRDDPALVSQSFQALFDTAQPLESRYQAFQSAFRQYTKAHNLKNDYQDIHAVSVYLTFRYSEEYFIFKSSVYEDFKLLVAFSDPKPSPLPKVWKMESNARMCQEILSVVQKDAELMAWDNERIRKAGCADPNHHLLVSDIIYCCTSYPQLKADLASAISALPSVSAAPPLTLSTDVPLNTILYGPPGTGKTYHTVIYAVSIIEDVPLGVVEIEAEVNYSEVLRRYRNYKAAGQVEFVTFHQSYGYEDFIEGIRPVTESDEDDSGSDLRYRVEPGVFKRFCEKAELRSTAAPDIRQFGIREDPAIWKVSLEGSGDNQTRTECLANGHIRIGWDEYGGMITEETQYTCGGKIVLNSFLNRMQAGDLILSCYNASTIDAIGIVTGEYEWHDEYVHYKRLRKVRWLVQKKIPVSGLTGGGTFTTSTIYQMRNIALPDLYRLIEENTVRTAAVPIATPDNYVFIIDEINRGNISKIFGELITLLEPAKRLGAAEEMRVTLPGSGKPFGIPKNVYLLGTMNTADRSIALLDTALRRRFRFREMMPQPELLQDISVENLKLEALLDRMNRKITFLYDREHTIGHAYFLPLADDPTLDTLAAIFRDSILPLLQEYFYDDYEKIRLVLGDNTKQDPALQFIQAIPMDASLFGGAEIGLDDGVQYRINSAAFGQLDAYRSI